MRFRAGRIHYSSMKMITRKQGGIPSQDCSDFEYDDEQRTPPSPTAKRHPFEDCIDIELRAPYLRNHTPI
jgi:hypothetical protein